MINLSMVAMVLAAIAALMAPAHYMGPQTLLLLGVVIARIANLASAVRLIILSSLVAHGYVTAVLQGYVEQYSAITLGTRSVKLCTQGQARQSQYGYSILGRLCDSGQKVAIYSRWPVQLTGGEPVTVRIKPIRPLDNPRTTLTWARQLSSGQVATVSLRGEYAKPTETGKASTDANIGLMRALVLADTSGVSDYDWQLLKNTGTVHLFIVSGLHLTALFMVVVALLKRLSLAMPVSATAQTQLTTVVAIISVVAYLDLVQWGLAAVRAALMGVVVVLCRVALLKAWRYQGLLVFCVVWLFIAPTDMLKPSYWLSVGCVAMLLSVTLTKGLKPILGLQIVLTLVSCSLLQQPFSWPMVLCNLVAIPLTSALVLPAAILGLLADEAGAVHALASLIIRLLLDWASWCAQLPQVGIQVQAGQVVTLGLATLGWWLHSYRMAAVAVTAFVVSSLFQALYWRQSVTQLDVGQGSAYLIRAANTLLVLDAGRGAVNAGPGYWVVAPSAVRAASGYGNIVRVVSHVDDDHAAGMVAVSERFKQLGYQSRQLNRCPYLTSWVLSDWHFRWLSKNADQQTNNGSCVLELATPIQRGLFTGDIEKAAERALVSDGLPSYQFVTIGHHGSNTSSTGQFIQASLPVAGLLSRGANNRYRHPSAKVLTRLNDQGVQLYDSAVLGALSIKLGKSTVWRSQRAQVFSTWWQRALNKAALNDKVKR